MNLPNYSYQIHGSPEQSVVTAIIDGRPYTANSNHSNYDRIVEALREGGPSDELVDLFDTSVAVSRRFRELTERVTVANGKLFFDGDVVDNSLTQQVLRFLKQGLDFAPLVKFFENVQLNPSKHSREQLYDWLRDRNFTITSDGHFLAYKGVVRRNDGLVSISSGYAVVDGEEYANAQIPNEPGSVVTMPRSSVVHDPAEGCSYGLHVGTYDYAHSFGPVLLRVKVNPRDVVSVPTDSSFQKVRVCRYEVLSIDAEREESPLWDYEDDDWYADDPFDEADYDEPEEEEEPEEDEEDAAVSYDDSELVDAELPEEPEQDEPEQESVAATETPVPDVRVHKSRWVGPVSLFSRLTK